MALFFLMYILFWRMSRVYTPPPHTKYTDHFSKRGFPKTVLTGTNFHKQLGFSAFSNLELPGLPHYPVAIIEADPSNVLSGSDWLLEADY